ncbi:hypothetical protein NX059_001659 [Plenodomus lindquistii]|nr:hypothetical protein NX059_001659 [Plenodomus lindquistii]
MMPHQSQGACMAIDAAALGILFNKKYFKGDVKESVAIYETVRLPRATRVQASAAKAAYNINERIGAYLPLPFHTIFFFAHRVADKYTGFSSNTSTSTCKVEDESKKLTIEEINAYYMYKDIDQAWAERRRILYRDSWSRGLPLGLKLSNGVTVSASNQP